MKKIISVILLTLSFFATAFAQDSLISAAKAKNYKAFEKLVKSGASLDETSENGMNVQLALAYFDPKDFKKACNLLEKKDFDFDIPASNNISLLYALSYACSYEKLSTLLEFELETNRKNSLTGLKPIDATQFSTYKFYSEQVIPTATVKNAEKVRKLLLKNNSEPFEYCPLTFSNVGNFFFCIFNIIHNYFSYITPDMLNQADLFNIMEENGQKMAVIDNQKLVTFLDSIRFEAEIQNYNDPKTFIAKLDEVELSEEHYALLANTGKNPIAPYQWIIINGMEWDEKHSENSTLICNNPDEMYSFVDFQIKDLTYLITIKLNY